MLLRHGSCLLPCLLLDPNHRKLNREKRERLYIHVDTVYLLLTSPVNCSSDVRSGRGMVFGNLDYPIYHSYIYIYIYIIYIYIY